MLNIAGGILIAVAALFALYVALVILVNVVAFVVFLISELFSSEKSPEYYRLKEPPASAKSDSKWD